MGERRMFTKRVTDDDHFFQLTSAAQALYLHLSMAADDDGFCNQISIAMLKAHAMASDLEQLLKFRYIYQFDNGVIVIKHWRMANALRKDRYTPTVFQEEMKQLGIKDNGSYTMVADWLPDGCQMVADRLPDGCRAVATSKDKLSKDNLIKESIPASDESEADELPFECFMIPPEEPTEPEPEKVDKPKKHKYGVYKHVLLTDDQYESMFKEYGEPNRTRMIQKLDEYIEEKGAKYKNHYLVMTKADSWVRREIVGGTVPAGALYKSKIAEDKQGITRNVDLDEMLRQKVLGSLNG